MDSKNLIKKVGLQTIIFLVSIFLVCIFSNQVLTMYPNSEFININKPSNYYGFFTNYPQVLVMWGIIYFTSLTFLDSYYIYINKFKSRPKSR